MGPEERYIAMTLDGRRTNPGDAVVPIMVEQSPGHLKIVGTGTYITRYGLFITASHVLDEMLNDRGEVTRRGFIAHLAGDTECHFRPIRCIHQMQRADVAVGHADNFMEKFPEQPLMNLRTILSVAVPVSGQRLMTYAYPENKVLDFLQKEYKPIIAGDYFDGEFLRYVDSGENPNMPCPYFETTIEIRSGASGGPVFDMRGRILGINCRGWDFRGTEFEGQHLSYIIPIRECLSITVSHLQLLELSWEFKQLPPGKRNVPIPLGELAVYGHVLIDTSTYGST